MTGQYPEAMRTTYDEDGPAPTRVVILHALAEQMLGHASIDSQTFAGWIDRNSERIYAAARARRTTSTGLEEVVLGSGDLLPDPSPESAAVEDEQEEVHVVAIGEPIESVDPLFVGSLSAAVDYVMMHDTAWRDRICIAAPGRLYGGHEIEALAQRLGERHRRG